jgi:flagellar assembly protein FliH
MERSAGMRMEGGRWIRPAEVPGGTLASRLSPDTGVDELAERILVETRRRVSALASLERDLEDKIRSRWNDAEVEIKRRISSAEEDVEETRRRADGEAREAKLRAEKDGRTSGFKEGFARGREEGYRLGIEEGRRDGLREGEKEGREDAARRVGGDLAGAASALAEAASKLRAETERIAREAEEIVPRLALGIARKILKSDTLPLAAAAVRNVEKAVDLIFRRGAVTIQVHPEDAPAVEEALSREPVWAEGLDEIEVRPSPEVARGGCRLLSGAGAVDMTVEAQMHLVEAALEGAVDDLRSPEGTGGLAAEPTGEERGGDP